MFEKQFSNVVSKTNDVLIYDLNEFLKLLKVYKIILLIKMLN